MAPETMKDLTEAGVFRLTMPKDRGGYEAEPRILAEVLAQVGRGDPSASWIVAAITAMNWWPAVMSDEGAEHFFETPDLKITGLIAPTGKATSVDGGVMLSGSWRWNTGGVHSNWAGLAAIEVTEQGPTPIVCLVPIAETVVHETWDASGMAGTATNEITTEGTFVPRKRIVNVIDLANGNYPDRAYSGNPYFNRPAIQSFLFISAAPMLGMARGAMDVFMEKLPGRAITYVNNYASAAEAPLTQHQLAKAAFDLEIAEMYMERLVGLMERTYHESAEVSDRIQTRAWLGQVARYSRSSVTQLFQASGASVIQHSYHLQRYFRDVNSLAQHALIQPDSSDELYGRMLVGLEPNSTMF
ncbi:hypothetical protein [Mycolicibacterium senegalense]|nr:hypothetical protein [Mycolicibacterium senegalense]MCV7336081.1 hypothetical protein [Mycolicibacterium senegalense]